MGIDSMRVGGGRCPPLLVGGLLVACLMLVCNWWTLSSENIDLVRQIDDLNEQLKISAEERDLCVTLRGNLEQRYKHAEDEAVSLHIRLAQQIDLKKKNDELEDSVTICKSELDSLKKLDATRTATLETLRLEKETINTQLDVIQDENKKLREEEEQLKDELAKLKLTCTTVPEKKFENARYQPTRAFVNKTQLGPVPESAVKISVAGQRGLTYHGIPILPLDPSSPVLKRDPKLLASQTAGTRAAQEKNETVSDDVDQDTLDMDNLRTLARTGDSNQGEGGTLDANVVDTNIYQLMKAMKNSNEKK